MDTKWNRQTQVPACILISTSHFQEFFENPAFRADGLKIYPTLVIRGTGLYELWKTGRYKSYPPNTLVDLVATILSLVPPWVRIYRVQRDIPMPLVRLVYRKINWMTELSLGPLLTIGFLKSLPLAGMRVVSCQGCCTGDADMPLVLQILYIFYSHIQIFVKIFDNRNLSVYLDRYLSHCKGKNYLLFLSDGTQTTCAMAVS